MVLSSFVYYDSVLTPAYVWWMVNLLQSDNICIIYTYDSLNCVVHKYQIEVEKQHFCSAHYIQDSSEFAFSYNTHKTVQ